MKTVHYYMCPFTHNHTTVPFHVHGSGPEGDHAILTTRYECAITGAVQPENRFSVWNRSSPSRQMKRYFFGPFGGIFFLCILQLHVCTEFIPADGPLRGPVDLLKKGIDLRILLKDQ